MKNDLMGDSWLVLRMGLKSMRQTNGNRADKLKKRNGPGEIRQAQRMSDGHLAIRFSRKPSEPDERPDHHSPFRLQEIIYPVFDALRGQVAVMAKPTQELYDARSRTSRSETAKK